MYTLHCNAIGRKSVCWCQRGLLNDVENSYCALKGALFCFGYQRQKWKKLTNCVQEVSYYWLVIASFLLHGEENPLNI
jgi:hypothetical protein